ncbi:MAG: glycosyltransferase [Candidatus Heimdallarchaeota archaeon]|nr:glycosyltransferase [Candidatus Heimdallarchaeota archaeon]
MTSVSVIIPTFNNAKTLRECLKSIASQTLKPLEVIISDGHSTDGSIEIAKEFNCTITYEEGGSRSSACNEALKISKGEIVAFTDSDVIAKEDWLEILVHAFEGVQDEKIACITGPNIEYPNESMFGKAVSAVYNTFLGGGWSEQVQSIFNKERRFVESAAGCNAAYKRTSLDEVLPFNESLITAEDTDINYRLIQKGYSILFVPDAIVFHQRPQNHKSFRNKSKKYALGKVQFYRTHDAGLEIWHLLPPLYFITGIFLLLPLLVDLLWGWIIIGYYSTYLVAILVSSLVQTIRFKHPSFLYLLPLMFIEGHIWWSAGILKEIFNSNSKK